MCYKNSTKPQNIFIGACVKGVEKVGFSKQADLCYFYITQRHLATVVSIEFYFEDNCKYSKQRKKLQNESKS